MAFIIIENDVVVGLVSGPTTDPLAVEVADDDPRIAAFLTAQKDAEQK